MTFDRELYGAFTRILRRKAGLTAGQFSERIEEQTGEVINVNSLMAIETGYNEPTVGQFMAINAVLYGGEYSPRAFAIGAGDMDFRIEE